MSVPSAEWPGPVSSFLEVTVTPGEGLLGDMNVNGLVDFDDIAGFVDILGGGQTVGAVPEPSTLVLVVIGIVAYFGWRVRVVREG